MNDIVERHRCEDSECPYFRKPSPDKCGCHKTRKQMADALIVKLKADNTYLAETLLEMGKNVVLFVDEFEDEGDRVYFGSTNHADYLRELRQKIDKVWYDQECVDEASSGRDLYAEMATLRAELAASREREAKLKNVHYCQGLEEDINFGRDRAVTVIRSMASRAVADAVKMPASRKGTIERKRLLERASILNDAADALSAYREARP